MPTLRRECRGGGGDRSVSLSGRGEMTGIQWVVLT